MTVDSTIFENQLARRQAFEPTPDIPETDVQRAIERVLALVGSFAPVGADYLVKTASGSLLAERVVTDTSTIAWDWATGDQAKANVVDGSITYAKIQNVSATDKLLARVSSGAGIIEEVDFTDFGQALVAYADEATFKAGVNLESGTDFLSPAAIAAAYQPLDATLTDFAAQIIAADKIVYGDGADSFAVTDFTSVARTLVAQTTQALMRTTGLGMSANGSSLVSAADYAAMRALLDLEAGTDFYSISAADAAIAAYAQPLNTNLTEWATLNPSSNGGSLVTAADYAAMRALLDLEAGTDFYSKSAADAAFQPLATNLTEWASVDPSTNGKSLVAAADYSAMRGLLDLEAGTDFLSPSAIAAAYQPLDASLTAYAALTTAGDKGIYFSGADTPVTFDLVANGRALLGQNYAGIRGLLDLEAGTDFYSMAAADAAFAVIGRQIISGNGLAGGGTLAADRTLAVGAGTGILSNSDDVAVDKASNANIYAAASNKVVTADLIESASAGVAMSDASTVTFDWDAGIYRTLTITTNRILGNPTNGQPGTFRTILLSSDGGPDTLTFGNQYGGELPTLDDVTTTKFYLLTVFCKTTSQFLVTAVDGSDA